MTFECGTGEAWEAGNETVIQGALKSGQYAPVSGIG
jgi:hypothetical protein